MMNTNIPFINSRSDVIVEIATPYSIGTGFYLKSFDLIVTNEHIIRSNKQVVISGATFKKQIVPVLYLDPISDLAFISPPEEHHMPDISLSNLSALKVGEEIMVIGDQNKKIANGKISHIIYRDDATPYIIHDISMNPANNGGPLYHPDGTIIGMNTFINQNGEGIGYTLPSTHIFSCIKEFREGNGFKGIRCASCKKLNFEEDDDSKSLCSNCGIGIKKISDIQDYEPSGICHTVESLIDRLGYDVALTRKGPNNWCIKKSSIDVCISYYEKTGLLVGDMYMCSIPESSVSEIFEFMLKQNYILEGITFSIKNNDIILSLLIYDQFINADTIFTLFSHLLSTSDKYDNILIDMYGGKSKNV